MGIFDKAKKAAADALSGSQKVAADAQGAAEQSSIGTGISDLLNAGDNRRRVEELEGLVEDLKAQMTPEMLDAANAAQRVRELRKEADELGNRISSLNSAVASLRKMQREKEKQLVTFDDEILVQDFGLYRPRFDFAESSQFKDRLSDCRARQREAIKNFSSHASEINWQVDGSRSKGRKMVRETARLLMMAYNGQCDEIVRKVKGTNVQKSIEQVRKSAETITKLGSTMHISIPDRYVALKIEEVQLAYEYARKKDEEKEALRAALEREREEKKLAQEIAAERRRLEKERKQYQAAYDDIMKRLENAEDEEAQELEKKAKELREKLDDVDRATRDVDYREANQKAGYVYVISNVGSFGEGVYKIGMTRRLDPMERVSELSDASVPFNFDVHALIFCDDAPALEAALHRAFEKKKVNLVNQRREFFRVSLREIENVVKSNFDKTVEFHETPDAEQFRTSEKMREQGVYRL